MYYSLPEAGFIKVKVKDDLIPADKSLIHERNQMKLIKPLPDFRLET